MDLPISELTVGRLKQIIAEFNDHVPVKFQLPEGNTLSADHATVGYARAIEQIGSGLLVDEITIHLK